MSEDSLQSVDSNDSFDTAQSRERRGTMSNALLGDIRDKNYQLNPTARLTKERVAVKGKSTGLDRIRKLVSKKKRRFIADSFNLDLTYVTDQLVAMGFPSQGLEAAYRNSMSETQRFLNTRHPKHYRVYNLCSEREYHHDYFDSVLHFPFDDHNVPDFDLMHGFCNDVADFLSQDEDNIAAIHCKAGKGRTGTMICCQLLHDQFCEDADQALAYYGFARTQNQQGVTIPSQRRWVRYYDREMKMKRQGKLRPPPRVLQLTKIFLSSTAPQWSSFVVENQGHTTKSKHIDFDTSTNQFGTTLTFPDLGLLKDVKVTFVVKGLLGGKSRAFSFWFNTEFIENNLLKLTRLEIDKVNKDKKCKEFFLKLEFAETSQDTLQEPNGNNDPDSDVSDLDQTIEPAEHKQALLAAESSDFTDNQDNANQNPTQEPNHEIPPKCSLSCWLVELAEQQELTSGGGHNMAFVTRNPRPNGGDLFRSSSSGQESRFSDGAFHALDETLSLREARGRFRFSLPVLKESALSFEQLSQITSGLTSSVALEQNFVAQTQATHPDSFKARDLVTAVLQQEHFKRQFSDHSSDDQRQAATEICQVLLVSGFISPCAGVLSNSSSGNETQVTPVFNNSAQAFRFVGSGPPSNLLQ